jgi:hypothetical protein
MCISVFRIRNVKDLVYRKFHRFSRTDVGVCPVSPHRLLLFETGGENFTTDSVLSDCGPCHRTPPLIALRFITRTNPLTQKIFRSNI